MQTPTRPALRYHGGKFRIAPWIIRHFPSHQVYVEPFAGAGSVLMRKPRARKAEILNDLDGEIVNLFRVLRDPCQCRELERVLRLTPFARAEFDAAYQETGDPIESARRLIVRAFMGFGSSGVSRKQSTGFRVRAYNSRTSSATDWSTYPDALAFFCQRLRGVTLENRPALEVIAAHDDPETLVYADPPYLPAVRASHISCQYRQEMTTEEHHELAALFHASRSMIVLSGYAHPLYDEVLFPDWRRLEKKTMADGARDRTEVLWLNPAAAKGIQQPLLIEESEAQ